LVKSQFRVAARHPTDIPRKQAISTILVKKVRKRTVLPSQRMHVNSKKRMVKLIRNKSHSAFLVGMQVVGESVIGDSPVGMLPALKGLGRNERVGNFSSTANSLRPLCSPPATRDERVE
jgi:hypothetical protein